MKATFDHTCMHSITNYRDPHKHDPTPPQHRSGVSHFVHRQRHRPLRGIGSVKSAFKAQSHRGTHMFPVAEKGFCCNQAVTVCESLPRLKSTPGPRPHGKSALTGVNIANSSTGKMYNVLICGVCVLALKFKEDITTAFPL